MHRSILLLGVALSAIVSTHAQPSSAAAILAAGDQAWAELVALNTVPTVLKIRQGDDLTTTDAKAKITRQADQSLVVSKRAHDFYSQFPGHSKAAEARKIEAITSLRAVTDGDTAQEQSALTIAGLVRDSRSAPSSDRFEVALSIERLKYTKQLKSKTARGTSAERVQIGEDLRKEFGDQPGLQKYYLEIARHADTDTASGLATSIVRSAAASAADKAEAQSILNRAALIGKPLNVRVAKPDGREIDLGQQQNKITAVIVWSPADPGNAEALRAVEKTIPSGIQVVYVAVGGTSQQLASAQNRVLGVAGDSYVSTGAAAKSLTAALQLQKAPVPFVYVINRAGKVVACGRLRELPALLSKAIG